LVLSVELIYWSVFAFDRWRLWWKTCATREHQDCWNYDSVTHMNFFIK
jgi:hypothetical protein